MQTLTHSAFLARVAATKGATIIGLETLTDAKARKTGNPFGTILKHSRAVGFVGADYESAVKREGDRQDADASGFASQALPWGAWLVPGKVIEHKGAHYLRTQSTPGQRSKQRAKVLAYRDTQGRFLSRHDVAPFLPAKSVSVKQASVGLDAGEQVEVRTFAFASILRVRMQGQTFQLVADSVPA